MVETVGGRQLAQVAEASLDEGGGRLISRKRLPAGLDCGGIAVDPEQTAARNDPLEDQAGMPRLPQGAVDRDRPFSGFEQLYYLF